MEFDIVPPLKDEKDDGRETPSTPKIPVGRNHSSLSAFSQTNTTQKMGEAIDDDSLEFEVAE